MVVGLQWDWAQSPRQAQKLFWTLRNQKLESGPENCFLIGSRLGHKAQFCKELQKGPKGDLGPENCFLIGLWTGPTGQNCKELQLRPKRSFGPRRLKEMRIGPEFQHGPDWGFWNHRSPILIKNTSVEKLKIPIISGPIFLCLWCYEITCTCISHVIHKCPQYNAVACISHHRNMLGNKCYFLIGNQIINRIMWLV